MEVWENEKSCGKTSQSQVFPQLFRVPPNFHERYHNFIETTEESGLLFLL